MQNKGLTNLAFQKFQKSFWGVISFWFISFVGFVSLFAYVIAPDNSQYSNQMHLSIHSKSPGFSVQMLVIPTSLNNNQNLLDRLFFGNLNPPKEIPISSYRFDNNYIYYSDYTSIDLEGVEKSIKLPENSNAMHPSAPISTGIRMDLIMLKPMVPALSMLQKRHAGVCSSNIQ